MSCEECRELSTHAFRSANDLIHALRLATEEVDRGVLRRVATGENLAAAAQGRSTPRWRAAPFPGISAIAFAAKYAATISRCARMAPARKAAGRARRIAGKTSPGNPDQYISPRGGSPCPGSPLASGSTTKPRRPRA